MKWIFKNQYVDVPAASKSLFGATKYITICTGGSFLPEDGETMYSLTPNEVVKNNQSNVNCLNWLHGFFGGNAPKDNGLVGRWTEDIDNNATLYYFIQDGIIHKMFICEYDGLHLSNVTGHQYIMEYNGNMMDMMPEDGDIIYDSYEEAESALKKE